MRKPLRVGVSGLLAHALPGELQLNSDAEHYVLRVHRLKVGAELVLFDPEAGLETDAKISALGKRVHCQAGPVRRSARLGLSGLTLYLARPKAAALEAVLRDAVALGVGSLVWLDSEHSVPRGRNDRWRAIALDSARQCLRGDLPNVQGPLAFNSAVEQASAQPGFHCMLSPGAGAAPLGRVVRAWNGRLDSAPGLSLWVGPEGGFSAEEQALLIERGVQACHLGPLVLRVPTAAAAALAVVVSWWWEQHERTEPEADEVLSQGEGAG
jgi:16S rRNA (uracil1498-N3)-methyltransferase